MAMERDKLVSLVTAAKNGDPDALNELFNAFYNDVYYFALKTVKDDELAGDITQEAFVEIINTLDNLKEPAAFVTWIKQITYHQCTRYFKKKKDVIVDEDEDGNTVFDTLKEDNAEFIPDEALDKSDFKKTIMAILDELSEEQRSATMMYYFDEMSVKQIAEIQGVSEGTVKSRLNYARKAIKSSVEEYEKKNGIKLHALPFFPFFKWLFEGSFGGISPVSAELIAKGVSTATGTAITASATATTATVATTAAATVTTAATTTAATTTAASIGVKIAAAPIVAKIIAGVVAASVVIGGSAAVILNSVGEGTETNTESIVSFVSSEVSSLNEATTSEDISSEEETSSENIPSKEISSENTSSEEVVEHTPYPVPEGCTYTTKAGKVYKAGESVTEPVEVGDTFKTADYTYRYGLEYFPGDDISDELGWREIPDEGWGVIVNDKTKTIYPSFEQSINGYPLKALSCAFMDCTNLVEVPTIPEGVSEYVYAFTNCTSLISPPVIPYGASWMNMAFQGCTSLTKTPYLPDSVENISLAFYGCTSLTTVTNFPPNLIYMSFAFSGCRSLVSVSKLPEKVERIEGAFQVCTSLTTAPTIPASVKTIASLFLTCPSLTGTIEINAVLEEANIPCNNSCANCADGHYKTCEECITCCPYANCLLNTELPITITGSCAQLEEIAATAQNGNVTVK